MGRFILRILDILHYTNFIILLVINKRFKVKFSALLCNVIKHFFLNFFYNSWIQSLDIPIVHVQLLQLTTFIIKGEVWEYKKTNIHNLHAAALI